MGSICGGGGAAGRGAGRGGSAAPGSECEASSSHIDVGEVPEGLGEDSMIGVPAESGEGSAEALLGGSEVAGLAEEPGKVVVRLRYSAGHPRFFE